MKRNRKLGQRERPEAPDVFHANADQSRVGVRTAALGLLAGAAALAYLLGRLLLPPARGLTGLCTLAPISLAAGLVVAWVGETLLKRYWPSGRWVTLSRSGLRFCAGDNVEAEIAFDRPLNVLRWQFPIRGHEKGALRPANWHCFALRMVQGEVSLILYAFLSPLAARELTSRQDFVVLDRKVERSALLKHPHAAHLAAERERGEAGMELEPADFLHLLSAMTIR